MNTESSETTNHSLIFAVFTLLSRLLGLIRTKLKAYVFGTSFFAVAFDFAFRLPNVLRNLVAEGALSQSFIPVYEEYKSDDNRLNELRASGAIIGFLLLILSFIVLLGVTTLPYAIALVRQDWVRSLEATRLLIKMSQFLFPYIFFISISSTFMSIQYCYKVFWAGSFGPALQNLIIILLFSTYLSFSPDRLTNVDIKNLDLLAQICNADQLLIIYEPIYVWCASILIAVSFQLIFQMIVVRRMGLFPKISFSFKHPVLKSLFIMMLPATFGAAVQELGQVLDLALASSIEDRVPEAIAALTYSHILIHLPMGVFGVAVSTASLPALTKLYKDNKIEEYTSRLRESIGLNLFFLLPASLGLAFFGDSIIELLIQGGSFNEESTKVTYFALKFYATGLLGYGLQKLFMAAFYAQSNSKTPARITALVLLFNLIISYMLMQFFDHGGLALGSALAAYLGALIYLQKLKSTGIKPFDQKFIWAKVRIILVNIILGLFLYLLKAYPYFGLNAKMPHFLQNSKVYLVIVIMISIALYLGLAIAFRLDESRALGSIIQKIKKKFGR